jgi:periplasmic protein TonB
MTTQAARAIAIEPEPVPPRAQSAWLRTLGERDGNKRAAAALLLALAAHAGMVAFALTQPPPKPALTAVTEVELAPPAPPPPPPPPPAPEAPPEAPKEAAPRARAPKAAPKAPAPAAAAPLRTIEDNVKTADEPVRFVTDPNGTAFGYGTVARGGTGTGAAGAQLPESQPPVSGAGGHGTAPELSRPPSLGELDPCRGFFPTRAQADRGEVQLKVRVEADGKVRSVTIARELPAAQGFGFAARDCLMSKRFSPALDKAGHPVSVLSPVTIRFSR